MSGVHGDMGARQLSPQEQSRSCVRGHFLEVAELQGAENPTENPTENL